MTGRPPPSGRSCRHDRAPPPLNSLRARLLIGSGIPLTLFVGVALISLSVLYQLLDALGQERHSHQIVVQALQQQNQLDRMILTVQYCPAGDRAAWESHYEDSRKAFLEANDAAQGLTSAAPKQEERLQSLRGLEDQWHQLIEKQPPAPPARPPEFLAHSRELADRMRRELATFVSDEEATLAGRREQAERQAWQSGWVMAGVLAFVTLGSLVIAWSVSRSVTWPVDQLRRAAGRVLAGRFEMEPVKGPNEIAQLIVDFNQIGLSMAQSLSSLREQEEGYRQYIGAVSQLMWRTDAGGAVVGELPAWQAFTGQGAEEVRGSGWLEAVHPEDRPRVLEEWAGAVRERRLFEAECRLRSAAGEHRCFACRGAPIVNPDGSVREWIGTCTDITERKEQERLRQEKEAAEAASEAKSDFLARASHELRTPLNAIIGMSRLLETQRFGLLNAKQTDYVADVLRAGEQLLALINDVLDVAEAETGRMELRPRAFAPGDAIGAVVSTLEPLTAEKGLSVRFEPPCPGEVVADPVRFKQVVYNFLANAAKLTPAGGAVTIRCQWVGKPARDAAPAAEAGAGAIRVEVTDGGAGVAPEEQRRASGTNSGRRPAPDWAWPCRAAWSAEWAAKSGSRAPGAGSTFAFVLPRQPPSAPAAPPPSAR